MRPVWLVVRKDLLRKVRSPLGPIIYLIFPVLFALLIGVTFGRSGEKLAPIRLALVDDDGGLAARFLRSSFTQNAMPDRFDVRVVDLPEATRLVEDNKVSALLRIPAGFSDSLFDGHSTHLEVVKNPAQGIYPQIVEEFARVLALGGGSAVRILSGPIQEIRAASRRDAPVGDDFVSDVSVAINHRMQGVGRYAFPPAIRIAGPQPAAEEKKPDDSPFRVALYVLPGMAIFALMMLALGSMADFPREVAHGTLARQFVSPVHPGSVIVGKILATWLLGIACIVILALVAAIWAGSGVHAPAFIGLSLAFALTASGFAAFIQSISRSERSGSTIGSILVMIMSMVGGSWIPLESLPSFVRGIAPYTLTYWGSAGYRKLLFGSGTAADLLPNFIVLVGLGGALSIAAVFFFGRRYREGD